MLGRMFVPTVVMMGIAGALVVFVYLRHPQQLAPSLRSGGFLILQMLPLLIAAFVIVGLLPAVIPREAISRWVGEAAGWKGILTGFGAGGLMMGPPYAVFPLVYGFYKAGAGTGAMVAFLTSWSTWQLPRIPVAVALLGPRLTIAWFASIIIFIPVAGFIAQFCARIL